MVGRRVATARRELGLNQKQFAGRLGVSAWTLDRVETGIIDAAHYLPRIAALSGRAESWFGIRGAAPVAPAATPAQRATLLSALQWSSTTGQHLVLGSIALLVGIRFFTEVLGVIPRAANFVDIPIFLTLSVAAMLRPRPTVRSVSVGVPIALLVGLCAVSVAVNLSRISPGPVLVFLYGFLAPIGVYAATFRLWPVGHALSLSRLLVGLGVVELLVVAGIDLPRFLATRDPDVVSGTFGTNAYQLVFFLLLFTALLAGIFTFEKNRVSARFALPLFAGILATILLAQYRALLVTTALTVLFIGLLLGTRGRGVVAGIVIATSFALSLTYIAQHVPALKFAPTLATLRFDPGFYVSERLKAAESVVRLYNDHPAFMLTGTGPGTFSSRAWQTFAKAGSRSRSNVQGQYVRALTGGAVYHTDVADKYVVPLEAGTVQGSAAVTSPFSTYLSLLAEVGIAGFVLMVGVYLVATTRAVNLTSRIFRRSAPADPLPALCIACATGFVVLLQMGFLENWFEVTRVTFPVWMLFAVITKEAQHEAREAM
jgi:DNA-binding XRE family transcriptional regulator